MNPDTSTLEGVRHPPTPQHKASGVNVSGCENTVSVSLALSPPPSFSPFPLFLPPSHFHSISLSLLVAGRMRSQHAILPVLTLTGLSGDNTHLLNLVTAILFIKVQGTCHRDSATPLLILIAPSHDLEDLVTIDSHLH